jgi:hypothetical protein
MCPSHYLPFASTVAPSNQLFDLEARRGLEFSDTPMEAGDGEICDLPYS